MNRPRGAATVQSSNWQTARDWIVRSIAAQDLAEGDRLPTEQEMQREIGVGRHSLRRAVAALAAEGVLSVEQGRGTFVRGMPRITYRIARRTRFRENLLSQGVTPGGSTVTAEVCAATGEVAEALDLAVGAEVHRVITHGLADGRPINLTRSYHPASRFPALGADRLAGQSITAVYADHGIADYHRRETSLYARLPQKWEARMLEQPADQPVIVMCKLDADPDGLPIGWSEAIWAAGLVRFSLDLPE
ncbi:phosphonate metabolism transcriptional regulator PhnF [Pseudooceanicola sp. LIPI14-2-Ac024]|uniref:phosphonate metabolism transcriptional regulator PhnF n=1 Tax=Pseudooceanicola sp. LIPI14-2-Ac024 TaxID=3344875 RepID=UPI0035CFAF1F